MIACIKWPFFYLNYFVQARPYLFDFNYTPYTTLKTSTFGIFKKKIIS